MSVFILIAVTFTLALLGRRIFGSWFNHVTLYSAIWGTSLALFEMKFINYYPLESATWIYIAGAWIAFVAGSLVSPAAGFSASGMTSGRESGAGPGWLPDARHLRNVILVLTLVAAAGVVQHWMILLREFGGFLNVIVLGNIVYHLRLSGEIDAGVPYLDSFALAASLFAGIYTGLKRKITLVALLPVLVVIMEAIGVMGRAKILIAFILFLSGYVFVLGLTSARETTTNRLRVRRWVVLLLSVALMVGALEFVRSNRGMIESLPGATRSLEMIRGASFITPSVYLYLTVHHGVFNQYLKKDEERIIWGGNTFAPVYRVLSSLGFDTRIPEYTRFYGTPPASNTGTWLREFHADFGPAGVFLLPFLFGFLCTHFWRALGRSASLTSLVVLSHLFVVVIGSVAINSTRLGYWLLSLLCSLLFAWILSAAARRRGYRPAMAT